MDAVIDIKKMRKSYMSITIILIRINVSIEQLINKSKTLLND